MNFHTEEKIARAMGLMRREVSEFRRFHLEQADWKKDGRDIALSELAIGKLATYHDLPVPDLQEKGAPRPAEPEPPSNGEQPTRKLIVVPSVIFNPRLVVAVDPSEPEPQTRYVVDVGRNENFCNGDELEAGPHETQTGILELRSPLPRNRLRRR